MTSEQQQVYVRLSAKVRERAFQVAKDRHPDFDAWAASDRTMTVLALVDTIMLYALERAVLAVETWDDELGPQENCP